MKLDATTEKLITMAGGQEMMSTDEQEMICFPKHRITEFMHAVRQVPGSTPAATWREDGEPDPHAPHYDGERSELTLGYYTDDELANAVFLHGDRPPRIEEVIAGRAKMPIVYLTAAKERIRWLSRALVKEQERNAAWTQCPDCDKHDVALTRECHNSECPNYACGHQVHAGWRASTSPIVIHDDKPKSERHQRAMDNVNIIGSIVGAGLPVEMAMLFTKPLDPPAPPSPRQLTAQDKERIAKAEEKRMRRAAGRQGWDKP